MSTRDRVWGPYVLRGGESLATLAAGHDCTVSELRAHPKNAWLADVPRARSLVPGDEVQVPLRRAAPSEVQTASSNTYAGQQPRALRWVTEQDLREVLQATGVSGVRVGLGLFRGDRSIGDLLLSGGARGCRFDVGDFLAADQSDLRFDAVQLGAYSAGTQDGDSEPLPTETEPMEPVVKLEETWGGSRDDLRKFVLDATRSPPTDQPPGISWVLVAQARLADGTPSADAAFTLTVDGKAVDLKKSGARRYAELKAARSGAIAVLEATATVDRFRRSKTATLKFQVFAGQHLTILERDADFKPPVVTNVAAVVGGVDLSRVDRVLCDFFLSRVDDRTRDALEIIRTGEPKVLGYESDLVPADPEERPKDFCGPAPTIAQYDAEFPNLRPVVVDHPALRSRLLVVLDPETPVFDRAQPKLVLITWAGSDLPFAFKGVEPSPIDKHIQVTTAFGAAKFFGGKNEPIDQMNFDRLWDYPFWYPNFLSPPTMVGKGQSAKPFPLHADHAREANPFLFTGTKWWYHGGAGAAHQISTTKRRFLGIFPMSGVSPRSGDGTGLSDWKTASGDEVEEFLYETTALLRRQYGVYAMPARKAEGNSAPPGQVRTWKSEIGGISLGGYSRACNETVIPLALTWSKPGHSLEPTFRQVILLDPPDGGDSLYSTSSRLKAWAVEREKRGVADRLRLFFVSRNFGFANLLLGGIPARFAKDENGRTRDTNSYTFVEEATTARGYPAPITFIFAPAMEWERVYRAWRNPQNPKAPMSFGGNDSHMLLIYFGLFMSLRRSSLGQRPNA